MIARSCMIGSFLAAMALGSPLLPRSETNDPSACTKFQGTLETNPSSFVIDLGENGNDDFADPRVFHHDGTYYAYATNNFAANKTNVPLAMSKDFRKGWKWYNYHDTLPDPGVWTTAAQNGSGQGHVVWDPSVAATGDKFTMYYSALTNATEGGGQVHCIGYAIANSPLGPFIAKGNKPLICGNAAGEISSYTSAISPILVESEGQQYIVHKYSGHHDNSTSQIHLVRVKATAKGTTLIGPDVSIFNASQAEYDAEGPNLLRGPDGTWFLLFVSGFFLDPSYGIKYVTSTSGITGPYGDASTQRSLLSTGTNNGVYLLSPGGPTFATKNQMMFMTTLPQNSTCGDNGNDVRGPRVANIHYNGTVMSLDTSKGSAS